jgi:hypothetical protein
VWPLSFLVLNRLSNNNPPFSAISKVKGHNEHLNPSNAVCNRPWRMSATRRPISSKRTSPVERPRELRPVTRHHWYGGLVESPKRE